MDGLRQLKQGYSVRVPAPNYGQHVRLRMQLHLLRVSRVVHRLDVRYWSALDCSSGISSFVIDLKKTLKFFLFRSLP